jgi:hypothetical protein
MKYKLKFKDTLRIFTGIWLFIIIIGFWYFGCMDQRPQECRYGPVIMICDTAKVSAGGRVVVIYSIASNPSKIENSFGTLKKNKHIASLIERGDTLVKQPNLCQWELHKPDTILIFYF